jgi:tRNA (uracil-5-)-methyltransferase
VAFKWSSTFKSYLPSHALLINILHTLVERELNIHKTKMTSEEVKETTEITEKYNKDDYSYLQNQGYTSEIFKIEVRNLPKYYGFGEIKKLFNKTLGIECHKIKIPSKNSCYGFICLKNDEDREKALKAVNGYKWKGNILKAHYANPAQDPLQKKRKQDDDEGGKPKKIKTVREVSEPLGHLNYDEQLDMKQKKIEEIMKQFNGDLKKANNFQYRGTTTEDLNYELRRIIASPVTDGYRNKVEFSIGKTVDGEIEVGNRLSTYAEGNTCVANVDELKMPTENMKKVAKYVKEFVIKSELQPFNAIDYKGTFRNVTVRETTQGSMMIIIGIHPQEMTDEEKEKFQKSFVDFFLGEPSKELNITSMYYEEIQKRQSGQKANYIKHIHGETHIKETLLGLKFRISPCSFFQANSFAAEKLYQVAIDLAKVNEKTTLLDVCCGTGTIGLCFAKYCKNVYGMEIIDEAIEDAKVNAQENGIENSKFQAGNADDLIFSMVRGADVDPEGEIVAIVDPPRAGLQTKSIQQLRNSEKITRLVYISCSPQQALKNFVDLTKNCSKTLRGDPFEPKVVVPVDLFPHTAHCELVILFERKQSSKVVEENETK